MQQWLEQLFASGDVGWLIVPAAVMAGLVTAVSAGCSFPVLGAVAGYSASRKKKDLSASLLICAGFMASVVVVLSTAGLVVGSLKGLGAYGNYFAGFMTILFGLMALGCLPIRLPKFGTSSKRFANGSESILGGIMFGLAMGVASAGITISCCAPLLWLTLGAVTAEGSSLFGVIVMALFAVGYSLPMVAIMFGVSVGLGSKLGQKWTKAFKVAGGLFLIAMGFYFLLGA